MSRHAILIANKAETSDPRTSVSLNDARRNIADIAERLTSLGQYSFEVETLIDADHSQAINEIKRQIDSASSLIGDGDTDCLLFYYFGHAAERNNDLHLIFKDSNTSKLPTLIPFQDIAKWVLGYGVRKTLFVLDCCFAGAAMYQAYAAMGPGYQFSIAASTVPTQRAHVKEGNPSFGAFSLFFFNGLRDISAASQPSKSITVDSLFGYTRDRIRDLGYDQIPYLIDGGLNNLLLAEAEPDRRLDTRFDAYAPRKSFYRKLWWLAIEVSEKRYHDASDLYKIVRIQRPIEFLTPIKRGDQTVYEPVKLETLIGYLERMQTLGILRDRQPLALTPAGRQMVASNGDKFNEHLLAMVKAQFDNAGTSLEAVDSLIRYKLQTRGMPTARELFLDARRREKLLMTSEWFRILIDLASNCRYFKSSSNRTYFPY
jgi:hypothetical protein